MKKKYDPLPIVGAHPEDEPLICIQLNEHWIPYLIGLLWPAKFPEYWAGTLDENRNARRDVINLIAILEQSLECGDMSNPCCDGSDLTIVVMNRITLDGRLEISIDGGQTWTSDPNDPANTVVTYPPPVTAGVSLTKCDAASNGKQHIEDLIAGIHENLVQGGTAFDIGIAIALVVVGILLTVLGSPEAIPAAEKILLGIFGAVQAVITVGVEAFDAYWDSDARDKILCALYCNIQDDGTFTSDGYFRFLSQMKTTEVASPALDIVMTSIKAVGLPGLNKFCAYGSSADADCSSCDCNCNIDNWHVQTLLGGTEVSRDASSITVDSVLATVGQWQAAIRADEIHECCFLDSVEVTGTGNAIWCHNLCGEVIDEAAYKHCGLIPTGTVFINSVLLASNAPFTVRFVLSHP